MTTVTRDYYSQSIYTLPFGQFNQKTPVEYSKCEEKPKSALIVPGKYISNNELWKYQKRKQCAYTLFLVHLPYYINKEIRIHVFYLSLYHN